MIEPGGDEPQVLRDALGSAAPRLSKKAMILAAIAGIAAGPAAVLCALMFGCMGAAAFVAVPVALGVAIGQRVYPVRHIGALCLILGLSAALPCTVVGAVEHANSRDALRGMSLSLSIMYSVIAGVGLFAVLFIVAVAVRNYCVAVGTLGPSSSAQTKL